ncbi:MULTISPECIES: MFS transporter [Sphingobium]|uniref:MFS transporter n=1 Tax=Sphingobium TaxID=165695 RepID=UPI0015EB9F59|nr:MULTISPECIES: MFS transporter [Sphingobium]MCW2361311.1 AAHS family 4-hydroxybenzoate transporter-like MFS transporter [Sphingobium sp. B10D3B]MCW2402010.1 AAHS family 4-hydroxybenzoate transporter-like MFS transporter [Sphingobium sp. B10D7B]MCW2408989.1 AAHS family 4-hydroxybenzoate transporter-like MFS transporter [Sphingobium xanthum]
MASFTPAAGTALPAEPSGAASAVVSHDLGTAIDNAAWSPFQKLLLGCFALVFAVDGLANQSLGIVLPALIADWGIPRGAFAPVTAANLAGVALGSIIGGIMGDRIGRRWALIVAILLFGLMTVAGGFTHDATQLLLVRFLDGLGIGAAIPNGAALISEFTPEKRRGRAIAIGMVFIPIGGIIAGGLGASVLEMFGWRTLFFVAGAMPILLALAFIVFLPESPSFLLRAGRHEDLARLLKRCRISHDPAHRFDAPPPASTVIAPLRLLLSPALRHQTLLLWGGFFTCLMASYTIFSWVPTMLSTLGFDLTMTSLGITTFHMGGVVGALFSGILLDRTGFSRAHMGLAGAAALLAGVLAVLLGSDVVSALIILPVMVALGFCMAGLHNTLYTLAATAYPTAARATGVGVASATGRLGAVLSSFTGVISLDLGGSFAFFAVVAVLLALCGLAGFAARARPSASAA